MAEGIEIGLGDHDGAGSLEALDGNRLIRGLKRFQDMARRGRMSVGSKKVILGNVGNTGQRPDRLTAGDALVDRLGLLERSLTHFQDRVVLLGLLETREASLNQSNGRQLSRLHLGN